jgi:hypothetical protein
MYYMTLSMSKDVCVTGYIDVWQTQHAGSWVPNPVAMLWNLSTEGKHGQEMTCATAEGEKKDREVAMWQPNNIPTIWGWFVQPSCIYCWGCRIPFD